MADGSGPPPPPFPVLSGAEWEDGVSGRGGQPPPPHPGAESAPGTGDPWFSGSQFGGLAAALLSLVPFDTKRHYWGGVIWSHRARPRLRLAIRPDDLSASPHPPAITRSFSLAPWSASRSRVIGLLHLLCPPSRAEGQSHERCFDAEIVSKLARTHDLSIFNPFLPKIVVGASSLMIKPSDSCDVRLYGWYMVYFSFIVKY